MAAEAERRAVPPRGWSLSARSRTLDGTIPLRAARSCPPLLEGNAFGLHLRAPQPIRVRRGLRTVEVSADVVSARAVDARTVRVELDTGLTVDAPPTGLAWSLGRTFNRRDRRVDVEERALDAGERLTVAMLVTVPRQEEVEIRGEIATLAAFLVDTPRIVPLAHAPAVGEGFAAFFDEGYFQGKRGGPTNRYRDRRRAREGLLAGVDGIVVAHAGGAPPRATRGADGVTAIHIACELDLQALWWGQRVELSLDAGAHARRTAALQRSLPPSLGPGAMRYLTSYATAHAPGDAHLFLKPATLIATPPDVVAVIDGPSGEGLEGMRGVVESSWFHAIPAVAEVIAPRARLPAGADAVRIRFARRDPAGGEA